MNKILSNALEWGVKILYIDGMLYRYFVDNLNVSYKRWLTVVLFILWPCRYNGICSEEKEGCKQPASCHHCCQNKCKFTDS